jgi:hypothetical protein
LVPKKVDHKKSCEMAMQFCNLFASHGFHPWTMPSNPKSQEITMIKSILLATAISFAFILPASAQQVVPCDEASLTKMRTEIDAMTDKAKQAETLQAWEAANTAFKANNLDECNARIGDAGKNLPPAATTTQ